MITTQTLKNAARAIECDLWTDPSGANYLVKDGAILRRWEPEHSSADSFELIEHLKLRAVFRDGAWYAMQSGKRIGKADGVIDKSLKIAVLRIASFIGESLCQ